MSSSQANSDRSSDRQNRVFLEPLKIISIKKIVLDLSVSTLLIGRSFKLQFFFLPTLYLKFGTVSSIKKLYLKMFLQKMVIFVFFISHLISAR